MYGSFKQHLAGELAAIEEAGLYKKERNIASAQGAEITLEDGSKALNFCANNYLGLADSPRLVAAAEKAMQARGYGMSSVRFTDSVKMSYARFLLMILVCLLPVARSRQHT